MKPFLIVQVPFLIKSYLSKITHSVDGLIFVPKDYPYYSMNLLEWVPNESDPHDGEHRVDEEKLLSRFTSNS